MSKFLQNKQIFETFKWRSFISWSVPFLLFWRFWAFLAHCSGQNALVCDWDSHVSGLISNEIFALKRMYVRLTFCPFVCLSVLLYLCVLFSESTAKEAYQLAGQLEIIKIKCFHCKVLTRILASKKLIPESWIFALEIITRVKEAEGDAEWRGEPFIGRKSRIKNSYWGQKHLYIALTSGKKLFIITCTI